MADIKKWNICTKKTYGREGQEKSYWPNVGQMTYFPARGEQKAGFKLELSMFPATTFFVFEQTDKKKQAESEPTGEPEGEVSADDIPF